MVEGVVLLVVADNVNWDDAHPNAVETVEGVDKVGDASWPSEASIQMENTNHSSEDAGKELVRVRLLSFLIFMLINWLHNFMAEPKLWRGNVFRHDCGRDEFVWHIKSMRRNL